MRVLLCNLDPNWEFGAQLHNHGLDVFADERFQCWDVGVGDAARASRDDPWGDWPRRIDRGYLVTELIETLELGKSDDHLFVFHWPALERAALREEIDSLGRALGEKRNGDIHVLTFSRTVDSRGLGDLVRDTWVDHVVLLSEEPRRRLYELRMLIEMFQDAGLSAPLQNIQNRQRVIAIELGTIPDPPCDAVMRFWPALAHRLLAHCEETRKRNGNYREWQASFATALADVQHLCDKKPVLQEPEDADPAAITFPCPWFFSRKLPGELKEKVNAFYRQLDEDLESRYAALNEDHQRWRHEQIERREPEILARLTGHAALALGLGETVRSGLENQQLALDERRRWIIAEEQAVLKSIRGDLTLETRRGADIHGGVNRGYRRPLFQEDEELKNRLRKAQEKAAGLAAREWFWRGLAVVLALALIPVAALRAPDWNAVGFAPYFGDPQSWLPDLAWLTLFAGCYLGFGFYQIIQRRRRWRLAIDQLQHQADKVRNRHFKALRDTFRYQYLVMAMRRLVLLDEQIERLRQEIKRALTDLSLLEGVLGNQSEYYKRLGASGAPGGPEGYSLTAELGDRAPAAWIRTLLKNPPPQPPAVIAVRDSRFGNLGELTTAFLPDGEVINITEAKITEAEV